MPNGRSGLASFAWILAVLAALAVVAGPLAIHAGVVAPFVGFRIFALGLLVSFPALILALIAMLRTRGPEKREGRRVALRATLVSAVLAVIFAVLAAPGGSVPAIHDITTDPDDPPGFVEAPRLSETPAAEFAYPRDTLPQQQAAYPGVAPILLSVPPASAFEAAERAAGALGWEIVRSDPASGTLEATSTSRAFRFVDDVSIRIRPQDAGSRVDVRSRSRVGKSDLGANAARIEAFAAEIAKPQ